MTPLVVAAYLAAGLVVSVVVGLMSSSLSYILVESKLTKPFRTLLQEKLEDSYISNPTSLKEVAMYGISCSVCVSFWVGLVFSVVLCAITGKWAMLAVLVLVSHWFARLASAAAKT